MWIRIVILLVIVLLLSSTSKAGQAEAELYASCAVEQTDCQSQCSFYWDTNERISQCRNKCYADYIRCRGGK